MVEAILSRVDALETRFVALPDDAAEEERWKELLRYATSSFRCID
jgi:hypothetical protein